MRMFCTWGNVLLVTLLAIAFGLMGLFTGWLVGQSRAPAIPTLLPLAVGLLGGFSYAVFEKRATVSTVLAKLDEMAKAAPAAGATNETPQAALAVLAVLAGGAGMCLSLLHLACADPQDIIVGGACFIAGTVLVGSGVVALAVLALATVLAARDSDRAAPYSEL